MDAQTWDYSDDMKRGLTRPEGFYERPDWTAELRRIEAQILTRA